MDWRKWIFWTLVSCFISWVYCIIASVDLADFLAAAAVTGIGSAFVSVWASDPNGDGDELVGDWLLWTLVMTAAFAISGVVQGSVGMYFTLWHWGVAFVAALTMYFVVPWSERHFAT